MEWMDEFDPDWAGDPRISTLKRMAFQAQRDIVQLQSNISTESSVRAQENSKQDSLLNSLLSTVHKLRLENSISNLYFQDKISKQEAKRLWDLYQSPDNEDHKVADATIESLNERP